MIRHLHDYSLVAANIDILSKRALRKLRPRDQMADQLDFLLEIRLRNLRRCRSLSLGLIWFLRWCKGRRRWWFFQARAVKLAQDMDVEPARRSFRRLHPDGVMDDTDHFAGIAADIDELADGPFRKVRPNHKLGNRPKWSITIHF